MRIRSITGSVSSYSDPEMRSWGKEMFVSATAEPDSGTWSLEEAGIEYLKLINSLSHMNYIALMARNMISKDSFREKKELISDRFEQIIEKMMETKDGSR